MRVQHAQFLVVTAVAACRSFEFAEFPPECDAMIEQCPPGGSSTGSTGDDGGIQTVSGAPSASASSTSSTTSSWDTDASSGDAPAVPPAIVSVALTPDPLTLAGAITVDVVADGADGVRLAYPGAEVELSPDPEGHFRGQIEVHTGLTNGTHEATVTPWRGDDLVGASETRLYTLALPAAGEMFQWDTMSDHGSGQIEALRVTETGHVVGLGTLYQNGTPRCFMHRRDLEGKYTEADDIRAIFPDKECQAIDLAVDGETLYLLVSMKGGDSWFWRIGSAAWGQDPTILRTGAVDEKAHALARSASGTTAICGTAPSPGIDDKLDGRVWPLFGGPAELDYIDPEDPLEPEHRFDETLRDCEFVDERLVAVGDVFGRHEWGDPQPPKRRRPLILEIDGQAEPLWHVDGLGPGNITQGSISTLAIDVEGHYVTGLYTCGDTCDQQGEIRIYETGGKLLWPLTLGASILPPQDIAWSPAGYIVFASAEATSQWSSKFLVQAYIPEQYEPVWTFAKAEMPKVHLGYALAVGPGAVVGGGVGGAGFPALAFLRP